MDKLIYVPQYPTKLRYQEWHYELFFKEFYKYFQVTMLGQEALNNIKRKYYFQEQGYLGNFSPLDASVPLELKQCEEFLDLKFDEINSSYLYLADLSFPGYFTNSLFHKRPKKCFAYCHATAINNCDYYMKDASIKYPIEKESAKLFDKIFVATNYHKEKLGWDNIEVVGIPLHKNDVWFNSIDKINNIVSVSRICPQKVNIDLENKIEKIFNFPIVRSMKLKEVDSWESYYRFLGKSKVLLITSQEETFGYQVVDAIRNNCIPIAPRDYSYPELLSDEYLYSNEEELVEKIKKALNYELKCPDGILNEKLCEEFFPNIFLHMKEA